MLVNLYALQAEVEAIKAEIEGMKQLNEDRRISGYADGYTESNFYEAANSIREIAERMSVVAALGRELVEIPRGGELHGLEIEFRRGAADQRNTRR